MEMIAGLICTALVIVVPVIAIGLPLYLLKTRIDASERRLDNVEGLLQSLTAMKRGYGNLNWLLSITATHRCN